jgi:hypothetical protein
MWRLIVTGCARRAPGVAALARQTPIESLSTMVSTTQAVRPPSPSQKIQFTPRQRALATNVPTSASGGAGVVDPPVQSFGAPPEGAGMPKEKELIEKNIEYHRFTDIYLGGLWNRVEHELGRVEDQSPDFE